MTDAAWWARPGLEVRDGRLLVAGRDAEALAREHGTPTFVYDLERIREQAASLLDAFDRAGAPFRLRLAIKAQRDPQVLAFVRGLGVVGIDACSPGEVRHALDHGWTPDEISYTGTNVSERDLDRILGAGVHVNVDLVSQLARYGRRAPGTAVGLRVNPRAGAASGVGRAHLYSGAHRPSKFGVLESQLDDALAVAAEHRLHLDTVHFHVGDGFRTDGLAAFELATERVAAMARRVLDAGHPLVEVNAGGGLGVPHDADEAPLDVDAYAQVLVRHLGPLGVRLSCEPGDFLTKEMGVLLAEVVTVDDRDGHLIVGVDAGYSVAPEHFIYGEPTPVVLCGSADAHPHRIVTVGGNINEGDDLWVEDQPFPDVAEGDIVAILRVGSYNQAMHLDHCLRPPAKVLAFAERRSD
ncbi:MAG TPA: diaminopimelate decarboxylase [Actinomycetota bacterium]|nr:diaminopimelate decarboxylase [Actinomycetota bacterium]